ncbi:hypothetical protein [Xanthomonas phage NEB7]|nr:hypothetical protein [Xanthomonas phage NEB7]
MNTSIPNPYGVRAPRGPQARRRHPHPGRLAGAMLATGLTITTLVTIALRTVARILDMVS